MPLDPATVRDRINEYYAVISRGDVERAVAMFAEGAIMRDPVGTPPATDADQRRARYAGIGAAFDAFTITPEHVTVCGDEAAAKWTVRAHSMQGKDVSFEGISTFQFNDEGRITLMSAYWEPAAVAAAMQS